MYLKIHRGSKQIGGNIVEIGTKNTRLIFDCGVNLPLIDRAQIPDNIQIEGLTFGKPAYNAVFISHYHNDHCGLLNRILPGISVYAGETTRKVLEVISDFTGSPKPNIRCRFYDCIPLEFADIRVTPIGVPHSAADAYMFLIQGDGKNILYTGDYKTPALIEEKMRRFLKIVGNLDVMISEGTNIAFNRSNLKGTIRNEGQLEIAAATAMEKYKGDVFVLCSSTNIDRIRAIYNACKKTGRVMAEDLFLSSITDCIDAATPSPFNEQDILGFVANYVTKERHPRQFYYLESHHVDFVGAKQLAETKNKVVFIRTSMIPFLGRLKRYSTLQDSVMIYSMWDGYRQKEDVKKLLSYCNKNGIAIETAHVSGHVYRQELLKFFKTLQPNVLVPIHCEEKERIEFLKLYDNCKMLNDKEVYEV